MSQSTKQNMTESERDSVIKQIKEHITASSALIDKLVSSAPSAPVAIQTTSDLNIWGHSRLTYELFSVCKNGSVDSIKSLIDSGADMNYLDYFWDQTTLSMATYGNHLESVRLLLSNGVEVDKPNSKGKTALHIALSNGYIEMAQLLIENGASVHIKCSNGMDALSYAGASSLNREKIVKLVEDTIRIRQFEDGINHIQTTPIRTTLSTSELEKYETDPKYLFVVVPAERLITPDKDGKCPIDIQTCHALVAEKPADIERLQEYVSGKGTLYDYFKTRNYFPVANFTD